MPTSCLPGLLDLILLVDTDLRQHRDHGLLLIEAEQGVVGRVPRNEGVEESADGKGIGTNHARGATDGALVTRMTLR